MKGSISGLRSITIDSTQRLSDSIRKQMQDSLLSWKKQKFKGSKKWLNVSKRKIDLLWSKQRLPTKKDFGKKKKHKLFKRNKKESKLS